MGDAPINLSALTKMEELNRKFTILLDTELKRQGLKGKVGFALMMFSFGDGSEMTWASNAERGDMVTCMKEFIAKNEGGELDELERNKRWQERQN